MTSLSKVRETFRNLPWWVKKFTPKNIGRTKVVPFLERGAYGWSRFDSMVIGMDKTILPALGDSLVYMSKNASTFPLVAPYVDTDSGLKLWKYDLARNGEALISLRDDLIMLNVDDSRLIEENAAEAFDGLLTGSLICGID